MVDINDVTTIKLDRKTKSRLDKLKTHKRETYDELLKEILNILNVCKINPEHARNRLKRIDRIQILSKRKKEPKVSSQSSNPQQNHQS